MQGGSPSRSSVGIIRQCDTGISQCSGSIGYAEESLADEVNFPTGGFTRRQSRGGHRKSTYLLQLGYDGCRACIPVFAAKQWANSFGGSLLRLLRLCCRVNNELIRVILNLVFGRLSTLNRENILLCTEQIRRLCSAEPYKIYAINHLQYLDRSLTAAFTPPPLLTFDAQISPWVATIPLGSDPASKAE